MVQFCDWFVSRCFYLLLKSLDTIFAEMFLVPRQSTKIFLLVSLFKLNYSAIIWTLNCLHDRTNCRTLSKFLQLCWFFGCPGPSSFSHFPDPFKPFMLLRYTGLFQCIIAISHSSMSTVSLALLRNFAQNFMLQRCSEFRSLIFRNKQQTPLR